MLCIVQLGPVLLSSRDHKKKFVAKNEIQSLLPTLRVFGVFAFVFEPRENGATKLAHKMHRAKGASFAAICLNQPAHAASCVRCAGNLT